MEQCGHCTAAKLQISRSEQPAYMLPDDVLPLDRPGDPGYQLMLMPVIDGENPHFDGMVTIGIDIRNSVAEFPINAVDLTFREIVLVDGQRQEWVGTAIPDLENERVILRFEGALPFGPAKLSILYSGKFNEQPRGFYLSHEKNGRGEDKVIACTQSQPADTRRWLPCFDQPGPAEYKLSFQLEVVTDENLTVRSNAAIAKEQLFGEGKKIVSFEPTNKLPTYVLALAVGELESSGPVMVSGVEVRIWAIEGSTHLMNFALKVMARCLPLLEEFHGVKYPNKKLDLIAVQEFAFGAMENDGMFIFRRSRLLIDELTATVAELLQAAITLIHETDHTYDGNRITMKDWSQLALNELRATFMSYLIADIIYPEWKIWDRFAILSANAMTVDGLVHTQAIVSPIDRIDQLSAIFNEITYRKGASVMRQGQLTLDRVCDGGFSAGMQHFNGLYAWGNASTDQLWDAIGERTGFFFRELMTPWMMQPGFPIVTVERAGDSSIKLRQSMFRADGRKLDDEDDQVLWPIPVLVRVYKNGVSREHVLHLTEREQTFDLGDAFDWLVANAGGHGFYRVQFNTALESAAELFEQLVNHVQTDLTTVERFNLVNDAWALLQAGKVSVKDYLLLIGKFGAEREPAIWQLIAESVGRLSDIAREEANAGLNRFVRNLVEPLFDELGFKGTADGTTQDSELRGIILRLLGSLKPASVKEMELTRQARTFYKRWRRTRKGEAEVLAACVKIIASLGDDEIYEDFLGHLRDSTLTPQQTRMFQEALCYFKDDELALRTMAMIVSGEIKSEIAGNMIKLLLENGNVREAVWSSVKEHFDKLKSALPAMLLFRGLEGVRWLDLLEDLQDVNDFFADHREACRGNEKPVLQTLEWQHINAAFRLWGENQLIELFR